MREVIALLLVGAGAAWTVLTLDKVGLVVAFAGVTLLARAAILERD